MAGSKIPRSSLVIHLKAGHAQLNRKSNIFGRSFHNRWSRGTNTLGTRVLDNTMISNSLFKRIVNSLIDQL